MLIVLSTDQVRERSPALLKKFNDMHQRCTNADYCTKKTPFQRLFRAPTGTIVKLAIKATDMVDKNGMQGKLATHILESGKSYHTSLKKEDLERVDEIR